MNDASPALPTPAPDVASRMISWIESAFDPLTCLDLDLRIVYANPAFGRFASMTPGECVGRVFTELCGFGDGTPDAVAQIRRAGVERNRQDGERMAADGQLLMAMGARPDEAEDGTLIGYVVALRDVTAHRSAETRLRERESDFRILAEASPDSVIRYDATARATYCNPQVRRELGAGAAAIIGTTPGASGRLDPPQAGEYEALLRAAIEHGLDGSMELTLRLADGEVRVHHVLIHPERDDEGIVRGALAIGRDVTDHVRARDAIAVKEREYRRLAENSLDHIVRWSVDGTYLYANPAFGVTHGGIPGELIGTTAPWAADLRASEFATAIRGVIASGEPITVEHRFVAATGDEQIHEIRLVPERDHGDVVTSVLGVGRDVTDVVRHRDELERLARTDSLTGVSNRQLLYELGPGMLAAALERAERVGIVLLDLDGFKHVNDRLGHRAGDELLRAVGDRLRLCIRDGDLLVRLGGDEFVLVVAGIHTRSDMDALVDRVRIALGEVTAIDGGRFSRIDASIGVVMFPDDGATVDVLLANADMAMYQAKRNGRGRAEHFRNDLSAAMDRRRSIEHALIEGSFDQSFELHLQPIYSLAPRAELVAVEALARWTHPTLGVVSPAEFIPIAEECGRIVPLGRWALRRAAELAVELRAARGAPVKVAVNVSTLQFALDDVAGAVREALRAAGCDPTWLSIEITESLLLEDSTSVQRALGELRAAGVDVAIDDFGMGYSALHYLARFPVDHLKIDRSFVQGIGQSDRRTELVRAFMALASALGLGTIAEGIETPEQLAFLRDLGCAMGQGYLLARPTVSASLVRELAAGAQVPGALVAAAPPG